MDEIKYLIVQHLELIVTFIATSIGANIIRRIEKRRMRKRWEKENYYK